MKTCNHAGDNFRHHSNVHKCLKCGGIAVSDRVVDILRNSLAIEDSQNVNQRLKAKIAQLVIDHNVSAYSGCSGYIKLVKQLEKLSAL